MAKRIGTLLAMGPAAQLMSLSLGPDAVKRTSSDRPAKPEVGVGDNSGDTLKRGGSFVGRPFLVAGTAGSDGSRRRLLLAIRPQRIVIK